ncbi:MAG TPA: IS1182 family transposase [Longimicrobium sp.]|jgi:transposase
MVQVSGYKTGMDREQVVLFPERLNDYIAEENEVRVIDAFVEGLDLAALGVSRAVPARMGAPGYDPRDLLKLYVYGYLNRVRSSRRLERECHRNVEVMWLMRRLVPDHKTIANFRKVNVTALKKVFREFTVVCQDLELVGRELTFVDGTKIHAVNGKDRNFTVERLKKLLSRIEERISEYLSELEKQDQSEADAASDESLKEKLERLKERKAKYEEYQKELKEDGERQISLTDAESRRMKTREGFGICYNAQIAVEPDHHLIVEHDVTNEVNDREQLAEMALAAKEALGVEVLEVVADAGYHNATKVKECEGAKITAYVPAVESSKNANQGLYTKLEFRYDAERDEYVCPSGQRLHFFTQSRDKGQEVRYYANTPACRECPLRQQCTKSKKEGRRIARRVDEPWAEAMEVRVKARPELQQQRKCVVEHPFGTMKRGMDFGYFLLKGLKKVRGEFSLMALAYNLRRVIGVLGVECLLEALRTRYEARQSVLAAA